MAIGLDPRQSIPKGRKAVRLPCALAFALAVSGTGLSPAKSADLDPAGVEFFEKKVRPVLAEHCYKCHSAQAKSSKGGLHRDSRDGLRRGGETGPAVVPGKPADSLLVKAVRWTDDALRMPPKAKLPAAVVADLERWVAAG